MGHGLRLRAQRDVAPVLPDDRRFEVRDAVEVHGAIRVIDRDGFADRKRIGDHVNAVTKQPRLEAEPSGRVVVAAGHDHAGTGVVKGGESVAEQRVCGPGRCRRIEHVARDDHHVDRVLPHLGDERTEDFGQSIHGRVAMEGAADMPVGGVQDSHIHTVRRASDIPSEACRGIQPSVRG